MASLDEIRGQDCNLSIPLYVRPANGTGAAGGNGGRKALAKSIAEWQDSSRKLRASMDALVKSLRTSHQDSRKRQ